MSPEERIQKLEEAQAFSERAVEELGEEIRTLSQKVAELLAAVKRMETRIAGDANDDKGEG